MRNTRQQVRKTSKRSNNQDTWKGKTTSMSDCGTESRWQLVRPYPCCMDKDNSYQTTFRRTAQTDSREIEPKIVGNAL